MKFGVFEVKPDVRKVSELADVLYDKKGVLSELDSPAYFMYRDLGLNEDDKQRISESNLRYDITVIPPRTLGTEFVKTKGHYHPKVPGQNVGYPEVYQVLKGKAHYLLQKEAGKKVLEVALIKAKKGDIVIIPPDFGHVTINPCKKELKMANWVCRKFSSIYEPYVARAGAAYFELSSSELIANLRYGSVPPVLEKKINKKSLLGFNGNMYSLVEELSRLDFLVNPQNHMNFFKEVWR